ncbi:MAG: S-layer homology domain-containing protein [Chloroflexota bacterium]
MTTNTKHIVNVIMVTLFLLVAGGATLSAQTRAAAATGKPGAAVQDALLPGDTVPAPAAFHQDNPQIVRGGNQYLVVWEDSRTNYNSVLVDFAPQGGEEGSQLLKDIYATRLDANGLPVDQTPIAISQAVRNQTRPQVAWNGSAWLVTWNTERLTGSSTTIDVMAARVSAAGVVLDNPALVLDSDPAISELAPMVSSDGTNWVVMWMDGWDDGRIDASRITPDGTILDPGGVSVYAAAFPDIPANPSLAFAGDEYLVAWQGNNAIRALRVSPTLQAIGSMVQISRGNFPRVASNGTDFLVTWKQAASVLMSRVSHGGSVLDGTGVDVSASHGGFPKPQPVWDGSQWIITWVATLGNVYAARVAANGTVTDPGGILVAPSGTVSSIAERQDGGAFLAWGDSHLAGPGNLDIFAASFAADGTVGPSAAVALGAPSQIRPDIAGNGSDAYLSVFVSNISNETRIKAQRLDSNGLAVDAEPFLVMGGSNTLVRPRVAWNGSVYLVVWEDTSVNRGFVHGAIFGKRISPQGTVLDATPIDIMAGNMPDVAALGSTFLVVDTYEQVNHIRFPMAVRVDGTGAVLGSPVSIGPNYSILTRVAAVGTRWLAVWQRSPTHDNPTSFVYAAFVNPDGTGAGAFVVAGVDSGRSVNAPDVAASSDQALISYFQTAADFQDNGDVYARRITADGTFLDADPGIQVTSAARAQFVTSAAWDGAEYVVAYEDYRSTPFLERPVSDIYATRVSSSGSVLDPNGFIVGNQFTPEVNPAVASNGGSYLIGFANFMPAQPFGSYRIDVQHGQAGVPPTPQNTHTPTTTSTAASSTATPTQAAATATGTVAASATSGAATGTSTQPAATGTPGGPTSTSTPTGTPIVECIIEYSDVLPGSAFYTYVRCLACHDIISGYPDGTYRPGNPITRGQLAKIVSNAAGFTDPATVQTFEDVPAGSTFYDFVERLASRSIINGYACGGSGEPCAVGSRPYFRPSAGVTRGQTAKIVVVASGMPAPPSAQQLFEDVPDGNTFHLWINTLASTGMVSGYPCGGVGEPCSTGNLPYFRPGGSLTRGQAAKIVSGVFFPNCQALAR